MTERGAARALAAGGHQVVHVTVRDGYHPQAISASAGIPLRLVFHRDEDASCSERVVFSTPRIDRHLAAHGETIIELPAQPPGEIRFTCAMGRYRGLIRVSPRLPSRRPSHAAIAVAVATSTILLAVASWLIAASGDHAGLLAGIVLLGAVVVAWATFGLRLVRTSAAPR